MSDHQTVQRIHPELGTAGARTGRPLDDLQAIA